MITLKDDKSLQHFTRQASDPFPCQAATMQLAIPQTSTSHKISFHSNLVLTTCTLHSSLEPFINFIIGFWQQNRGFQYLIGQNFDRYKSFKFSCYFLFVLILYCNKVWQVNTPMFCGSFDFVHNIQFRFFLTSEIKESPVLVFENFQNHRTSESKKAQVLITVAAYHWTRVPQLYHVSCWFVEPHNPPSSMFHNP